MNKNRKRYSKKTGIRAMALSIAAAMAGASRSVSLRTPLVKPRRSWERITPELPLAPRREPEEMAFAS